MISLRKQNMFFVEMKSENCISPELYLKVRSVGWQPIEILRHEHLQARLLDTDFCQWIDHNTLTCENESTKESIN